MKNVPKSFAVLSLAAFAGAVWLSAQSTPAMAKDPVPSKTMNPSAVMKTQSDTDKIIAVVQQVAVAMERGDLDAALARPRRCWEHGEGERTPGCNAGLSVNNRHRPCAYAQSLTCGGDRSLLVQPVQRRPSCLIQD